MPAGEFLRTYEAVAEEALHLAEALGDEDRAPRACGVAFEALHRSLRGVDGAFGVPIYRLWSERADRHAAAGTQARVLADIALGSVRAAAHQHREERDYSDRAFALARRLDDNAAIFEAGQRLLRTNWWPELWPELLTLAGQLSTHARDGVRTRPLGIGLGRASTHFLAAGERQRTEDLWGEIEALAKRTGDAEALVWQIQIQSARALFEGSLESALALGREEAARAQELGAPLSRVLQLLPLAYLGRAAEGLDLELPDVPRLLCLARAGRTDEASAELGHVLTAAGRFQHDDTPAEELISLLEAAIATGARDHVASLAIRLSGLTAIPTGAYVVNPVARHLGAAAELLGDHKAARAEYERALDWATKIRHRPEIALTRLQLAELLLHHYPDERAAALDHLDFAIKEFEAMKMAPSLEKALALRSQIGG